MTLPADAQAALDSFEHCTGWEQRARLLMQWGQRLPELSEADKTDANRVHGCESQMWLVGEQVDGHWQFAASSEARLIRGLVALLLVRVNGLTTQELLQVDLPGWFKQLGLSRQLSPSRSNGLNAVLVRMRELAA
ncbi:Fe-S metabolism protein SufE [Pseudomonas fragi]|uniref:SufE family protein n=1 Tax=Pseudomonas TaxID=286 RepID=UPI000BA1F16D|nr:MULTISPECIES: SufE family protein [Pseudomonas]MDY7568677.1 SufE family protein [Pseudomonas sp. CCC4.1]MEB0142069.1 SufE family protein [Pseudomonas sp. CCC4.1]PAA43335.1 Fe-S metabolism protein SufE [Pseudomonas fragi]